MRPGTASAKYTNEDRRVGKRSEMERARPHHSRGEVARTEVEVACQLTLALHCGLVRDLVFNTVACLHVLTRSLQHL